MKQAIKCTMCYDRGWEYCIDQLDGKIEDWGPCFKCPKGRKYAKLTWEKQEKAFNDYVASLPDPDVDDYEDEE